MTLLSVVVVEHLAQFAREGLGLTGVSGLPAEEAAVVARERGRLLTEQLGGRDSRASSERVQRLLADGDHNARWRRGQRVYLGPIAELDENTYERAIKITDAHLAAVNLAPDKFHGEWNYVVKPAR